MTKPSDLASLWEMAYPTTVVEKDQEFFKSLQGKILLDQALSHGLLSHSPQFGHPDCWAIRKARSLV